MKITKKWLACIVACMMVCTAFVGCGKSDDSKKASDVDSTTKGDNNAVVSEDSSTDLEGTLDIFQFKVEINDALKAATEKYMKLHPGVKVNLETVGGGDDYGAALRTKMQNSDQPDIYNIGGPQDVKDWNDNLEDLSSEEWIPNVVNGLLDDVSKDSKVFGMPMAIEGYGFIYNKGIFEAAGIDAESLKTFDEIDAAFGKLKEKIDNGDLKDQYQVLEAVIEYPAKEKWVTGMHTSNVAFGQEFANCTEAYNAKELEFTYSNELKDLVDLQVKYTTNADNPSGLNAVDYSMQAGGGLAIERVAVIQQGNWVYPVIKEIDENIADNLGVIPIPLKGVSEGNTPIGVPMYWAVNSQSDDNSKAIAKDFLNWLYQSDEGKNIVIDEFNFIPPFTNYGDLKPADPVGAEISQAATEGTIAPWVFNGCPTSWAENVLGAEIQAYLAGNKTWDEVIDTAKESWKDARK
ncbi:ABC transporter substrate-binding protein [Vallitalea longa]|uniref:ABC transporter substrate-binding protein n=1 Tax=Vallitalea longa TaxID=2936439 RepID=A0A9W6DEE7_9FIRM|nr:extracellular solute-binding protein [Vallitalea longa]GKX29445.1 ABC transporter substrate-binding protein [Vallitalea longa]